MKELTEQIRDILCDLSISEDNKGGIISLTKGNQSVLKLLLEYLKCNHETISKNQSHPADRGSTVLKHLSRILLHKKMHCPFYYTTPRVWEIIPESQRKFIHK